MPVLADDGSVEDNAIQVVTCFANDPQSHMMVYPEVEALIPSDTRQVDEATPGAEDPGDPEGERIARYGEFAELWILGETEEDGSVVFDIGKKDALEQIFGSGPSGICVRDLRLASEAEKLELSSVLWEQGIVHVADGSPSR